MRYRLSRRSGSVAFAFVLSAAVATPLVAGQYLESSSGGALNVAQSAAVAGLPEQLDALLADSRLDGAHIGVVVRKADSGEIIYSRNGDKRFNPASNEKLLTTSAAAQLLGPAHTFSTTVTHSGLRRASVVTGDLYLKGTGDPTITPAAYDELAKKVADSGIKQVLGGVVADDSWFDNVRLGTEWAWDDEPFAYAAQISALTVAGTAEFDTGVVRVESGPGATVGAPAAITLVPATTYVKVVNRAVTGAAGSARTISVDREHGTNTIVVTGSAPFGSAVGFNLRSVDNPTAYASSLFQAALARHGVRVTKPGTIGTTPAVTIPVTSRQSIPLGQILVPLLKLSNNGHAEILVKSVGRKMRNQGTWSAGLGSISTFLADSGVRANNLRMVDGSGLSRQDLITPEEVTALLHSAQSKPWFTTWYDALPIAGNPARLVGGTLASRMVGTAAANNVHAKTGSLTSVSALSGYVTNAAGEKLIFSVISKDWIGASTRSLEDSIAVTLANSGGTAATAKAKAKQDLARLPKPRVQRNDPATRVDESALECSWVNAC